MNYPEFEKFDLNKKEPSIATPDTINSAHSHTEESKKSEGIRSNFDLLMLRVKAQCKIKWPDGHYTIAEYELFKKILKEEYEIIRKQPLK
jgi:hypothetical protein